MPKRNRSHFARANDRKKTSGYFERSKKGARVSRFTLEYPRGDDRSAKWSALHKAWIGYKIAMNKETFFDRMYWAQLVQDIQSDLGVARASFPQLGLLGDVTFLYDKIKESELQDSHDELWYKEYKKRRKQHIKEIVDSTRISDEEKEWLYDGIIPEYAERLIMI